MLTFRQYLESLRKKSTVCVRLLRRLAGSTLDAGANTFRAATLALVHLLQSTARRSGAAMPTLGSITYLIEFLLPTPIDNLFVLADILPTEFRRKRAILPLARRPQGPEHILNERLLSPPFKEHR